MGQLFAVRGQLLARGLGGGSRDLPPFSFGVKVTELSWVG